jgi:hypothetical protein
MADTDRGRYPGHVSRACFTGAAAVLVLAAAPSAFAVGGTPPSVTTMLRTTSGPVFLTTAATSKGTKTVKPCYMGLHPHSSKDPKAIKVMEQRGTLACEQPPKPNMGITSVAALAGSIANTG